MCVGGQVKERPDKITSMDHAVECLTELVNNLSLVHDEHMREDIKQTCWVRILEQFSLGVTSTALLVEHARNAAKDEVQVLTNHGFTPFRSRYSPPVKQDITWGADNDGGWQEPSYLMATSNNDDMFAHLLLLCETKSQRDIVAAYRDLVNEQIQDGEVVVSQSAVAAKVGCSQQNVSLITKQIHQLYLEDLE